MDTLLLRADQAELAGEILRGGGLVAIPTETVYGLAADAYNEEADARIFAAKGRPADNPLIVHICDISQLSELCESVPEKAMVLAGKFWPGPLTMVLPRSSRVPDVVTAGMPSVAIRFPSHKTAQAIIKAAGVPLAAPSANLSGSPSPTTFAHVCADMRGRIEAIVDGGDCEVGVESTIVSFCAGTPRLLRPGGITLEQLRDAIGEVLVDKAVTQKISDTERVSAPGMKYRHYAPKAPVKAICGEQSKTAAYIAANAGQDDFAIIYSGSDVGAVRSLVYGSLTDPKTLAHGVFAALRQADTYSPKLIYIQCPPDGGIGLAVANRIKKAAGFDVLCL